MVYRLLGWGYRLLGWGYRLLGWGVVGGAYHKIIRLFHVVVKKLHLIIELVHRIRNILKFYMKRVKISINRCNEQCCDCIIRILSITLDCFIRVYWDIMPVQ